MNNEVYKEVYGHILNDAQRIRKEIMSEWGDILMFGGSMPEDVVNELSTAARITGLAFDALSNHDVAFEQVANKPDLFRLTVREESYVCHKSAIPSMSGFLDVVNVPGVPSSTFENSSPVTEKPVKQEPEAKIEEDTEDNFEEEIEDEDTISANPWDGSFEEDDEETIETTDAEDEFEDDEDEDEEIIVEEDDDDEDVPHVSFEADGDDEDEDEFEVEEEDDNEDSETTFEVEDDEEDEEETDSVETDEEDEEDEEVEETTPVYPKKSAQIIGGPAQVASIAKRDLFIEESQKNRDDFIYDMYQLNLTHSGYSGGGKPTELFVMIAPLKISKLSAVTVPIIVSVFCNGKIVTKSSYDQAEEGKNIVQLDVNEFYLMFRGSFDANGKFMSYITTAGISANQGDILSVASRVEYGNVNSRTVNNGHIKIRSIVDDEEGTIEVFPFGDPEDEEFIVLTKNDEFVDYLYISEAVKGLKKAVIFQEGRKTQVVCSWDANYEQMSLELKSV